MQLFLAVVLWLAHFIAQAGLIEATARLKDGKIGSFHSGVPGMRARFRARSDDYQRGRQRVNG
jgi:hypothetical protein